MIVDNFNKLADSLYYLSHDNEDNDKFYMIQIMTRSKDTGEKPHIYRTMFVDNKEYLVSHKDMIVKLCELFNARAYISTNPSSYKQCSIKMLKELADIIENGENGSSYKKVLSLPEVVAGKYTCGKENKLWVVDLDDIKDKDDAQPFIDEIEHAYDKMYTKDGNVVNDNYYHTQIIWIPTVNGSHLLVSPFDRRDFKNNHPGIEIHDNNPTLLYYNKK